MSIKPGISPVSCIPFKCPQYLLPTPNMRPSHLLISLISFLLTLAPSSAQNTTAVPPPILTHIFTATVSLGQLVGPVPVRGGAGSAFIGPFTGGKIAGPALNATIFSGGSAVVTFTPNQTIATPVIEFWGNSSDGVPFYVTATGVGALGAAFATLVRFCPQER